MIQQNLKWAATSQPFNLTASILPVYCWQGSHLNSPKQLSPLIQKGKNVSLWVSRIKGFFFLIVFLLGFGCVGGVCVHFNSRREQRTEMSATLTDLQPTVLQSPGTGTARQQPCTHPHISPLPLNPILKESTAGKKIVLSSCSFYPSPACWGWH